MMRLQVPGGRLVFQRLVVLTFLAALVLSYQGILLWDLFTDPRTDRAFGFEAAPVNGVLTILSVRSWSWPDGPTPASLVGILEADEVLRVSQPGWDSGLMKGQFDAAGALRRIRHDHPLTLEIKRGPVGRDQVITLTLPATHPPRESLLAFLQPVLSQGALPLVFIAVALFVGFWRIRSDSAFLASLLLLSFAGAAWGGSYAAFPPVAREAGLLLYVTLFSCWSYLFMRFFLLYPDPSPLERSAPWVKRVLLAFPVVFTLWNCNWAFAESRSAERFARLMIAAGSFDKIMDVAFLGLFALGFACLIMNLRCSPSRNHRRRLEILLVGSAGALPYLALYFYHVVMWAPPVPTWLHIVSSMGIALFPILFAYAVARHSLLGIRPILRTGLRFALLSRGFLFVEGAGVFVLLFYGAAPVFEAVLGGVGAGTVALLTAFVTMGAVLLLRRLNGLVMRLIERRFFREAYDGERILTELSMAVRRLTTEPLTLLSGVAAKITASLHPGQVAVFIRGEELLRLPSSKEAFSAELAARAREAPGDFFCLRLRRGPGRLDPGEDSAPVALRLPGTALTVQRLEASAAGEPYALTLNLDDPHGWAAPLRAAHPGESSAVAELSLLAGLGIRLLVPLVASSRLLGFIALSEKQSEEPYSAEDKELLIAVGQQVALALEHGEFLKQAAEEMNLRRELEIAREVQERLFPQVLPPVPGLRYAGMCQPARSVGGDYYDFIDLGSGRLGVALGDVAGKGISAALLMASLQAMLRIHSEAHRDDPERLTADINRHLCNATHAARFASFFYGIIDISAGTLSYVNAGHNPPMLFRFAGPHGRSLGARAASPASYAGCDVLRLNPTGMILGVDSAARYTRAVVPLEDGDLLLAFTDGITEAANPDGEEYGEAALGAFVERLLPMPAEELMSRVIQDVRRHLGGGPQADDMTLLVATIRRE